MAAAIAGPSRAVGEPPEVNYEDTWGPVGECEFYDPMLYANLADWFNRVRPLEGLSRFSELMCGISLHPKYDRDIREFKRKNRRFKLIPEEMIKRISANKELITAPENKHLDMKHAELLNMAEECDMLDGFWYISCSRFSERRVVMESYFIAISQRLRILAKQENLEYVKVEATLNHYDGYGILSVSIADFTDMAAVRRIGLIIKDSIERDHITSGYVQDLSFKPRFYYESGRDLTFANEGSQNIYHIELMAQSRRNVVYETGVEEWLADFYPRRSARTFMKHLDLEDPKDEKKEQVAEKKLDESPTTPTKRKKKSQKGRNF